MKVLNKYIVLTIVWLTFFLSTTTFSQTEYPKIDSLNKTAYRLTFSNIDSAFILAKKAKRFSIVSDYSKGIAQANYNIGTSYFLIEKKDSALHYLHKSIILLQKIDYRSFIAHVYNMVGIVHHDNQNFTEAIKYYNYALEFNKENKDSTQMCFSYSNIGEVFGDLGDVEKEMEYLLKGYEISKNFENSDAYAFSLDCIGNNYVKKNKFEKALYYFNKEMELAKKLGLEETIALINNNFATLYFAQNNFNLALKYIDKAINSFNNIGSISYSISSIITKIEILEKLTMYDKAVLLTDRLLTNYSNKMNNGLLTKIKYLKGKLNYNVKAFSKAKSNLQSVLLFVKSNDNLSTFRDTYELLYKIAKIENNPKEAFEQYKNFATLRDSVNIIEVKAASMDFEKLRELKLKEKEIADLKKDKIIADLEISSQESFRNFLYLTFILLGIIILIITLNNLRIRTLNKKLNQLHESEERFLRIISHDIRNSLGAVINFSNMLVNDKYLLTERESDDSIAEINKAALATNNLLTNLLQWTLAKKDDLSFNPKDEKLKEIIEEGISSSQSLITIKELELTINVDDEIFVFIDSYSITSVIRNLLTNAIKFSNLGGKLIFTTNTIGNFVELSISDTGVGMDAATVNSLFNETHCTTKGTNNEKGTGIGISLVKKFVQMNGGTIDVKSKLGKGSTFTFSMPIGENKANDKNHFVDLPNKNKKPESTEKIRKIAI